MKKKIIILLSVVIILLMGIVVWFNIPLDLMDLDPNEVMEIVLLSIQMIQLEKIHFSILLQREILITAILKVS